MSLLTFKKKATSLPMNSDSNIPHHSLSLGSKGPSSTLVSHTDIAEMLLDYGANMHVENNDAPRGLLVLASERGHIDTVQMLLRRGADIHVYNDSALSYASENGHTAVVRFLLSRGADLYAANERALIMAALNGHVDTVSCLLSAGATRVEEALATAAIHGQPEVVRFLLDREPRSISQRGLDDAFILSCQEGSSVEVIRLLLDYGANINVDWGFGLSIAIEKGYEAIVQLLRERGAAPPLEEILLNDAAMVWGVADWGGEENQ